VEGGLGGDPGLDAVAGALVGGGVADDAAGADVFAGEFELGFDEDDGVAAGFEDGEGGGEDEGEGDEGDVGDDEVHEFGDIGGGHVADVEVFAADDAGVVAEFPDELVGADIVGVDSGGAVLEEAVGEAAGGGTDIEADEAGDIDVEVVQGAFEFEAAAADVAWGFFDPEDGVEGDEGAGFEAGLIIDENLAGEDEAFGLFAGGAKALLYECLVQTRACHGERKGTQGVFVVWTISSPDLGVTPGERERGWISAMASFSSMLLVRVTRAMRAAPRRMSNCMPAVSCLREPASMSTKPSLGKASLTLAMAGRASSWLCWAVSGTGAAAARGGGSVDGAGSGVGEMETVARSVAGGGGDEGATAGVGSGGGGAMLSRRVGAGRAPAAICSFCFSRNMRTSLRAMRASTLASQAT
jgi:hypothetical protein